MQLNDVHLSYDIRKRVELRVFRKIGTSMEWRFVKIREKNSLVPQTRSYVHTCSYMFFAHFHQILNSFLGIFLKSD